MIKRGEEGRFHGGAQSIALRVEGFAQSDALRSAPVLNHTRWWSFLKYSIADESPIANFVTEVV